MIKYLISIALVVTSFTASASYINMSASMYFAERTAYVGYDNKPQLDIEEYMSKFKDTSPVLTCLGISKKYYNDGLNCKKLANHLDKPTIQFYSYLELRKRLVENIEPLRK